MNVVLFPADFVLMRSLLSTGWVATKMIAQEICKHILEKVISRKHVLRPVVISPTLLYRMAGSVGVIITLEIQLLHTRESRTPNVIRVRASENTLALTGLTPSSETTDMTGTHSQHPLVLTSTPSTIKTTTQHTHMTTNS